MKYPSKHYSKSVAIPLVVLLFTLVYIFPSKSFSQSYSDSTIVYLEWMNNPTTTMIINWIGSSDSTDIRVNYRVRGGGGPWLQQTGSSTTIPDISTVIRNSVEIIGLTPGAAYEFRIHGDPKTRFFRTVPSTLTKTRFIVTGDVYGEGNDPILDSELFIETAIAAANRSPFFAVLGGDLVHHDTGTFGPNTLHRYFKFLHEWYKSMVTPDGYLIPIVAAVGNHELPGRFGGVPEDAIYFHALFNFPGLQGYRTLDFGNYLSLIVLNTDHTIRVDGVQQEWLRTQLNNRRGVENVFPVYHVPAYPSARPALPGRGLEVRVNWVPIFEEFRVRAAFEHDNHTYKRTHPILNGQVNPCGVRYYGDGGFGVGAVPAQEHWYLNQTVQIRHFIEVVLTPGTRRIAAVAYTGNEVDAVTQNTLITPPSIASATNISANSFRAQWNPVCFADEYLLDVSTNPNFTSFVSGYQGRVVTGSTSFNVTGLEAFTTYYYRVRARDNLGNQTSGFSNATQVTTSSNPPVASAATNVTTTGFRANWSPVSGANQYRLDVSTNSEFTTFVQGFNNRNVGNTNFFDVTGLPDAQDYYYRVRAVNTETGVQSSNSTVIGIILPPNPPLITEVNSVGPREIEIVWQTALRVNQYRLDISTSSDFSSFVTGFSNRNVGNEGVYVAEGLQPNRRYYVRMRALNTNLDIVSANSGVSSTVTLLDTPQNLTLTAVGNTDFAFSWDPVEGADEYIVDIATDPNFTTFFDDFNGKTVSGTTQVSINNAENVQIYYIRLRANGSAGSSFSLYTPVISATTLPFTPELQSVSEVRAVGFTVNWNPVPNITHYELSISHDENFTIPYLNYSDLDIGDVTSYELLDVLPSTQLFFRVRAVNSELNVTGAYSVTGIQQTATISQSESTIRVDTTRALSSGTDIIRVTVTVLDPDSNPLDLVSVALEADSENLQITTINNLSDEFGETHFEISNPIAEQVILSARAINTDLLEQKTVQFVPYPPVLKPVSNLLASSFTIHWELVPGAGRYYLDVSEQEDFSGFFGSFENYEITDSDFFTITGLYPGDIYYFRLRADAPTGTSENSEIKFVTTPQADPRLSEKNTDQEIVLADGEQMALVRVVVRGEDGIPMEGVPVRIDTDNEFVVIENMDPFSNSDGLVDFHLSSEVAGKVDLGFFAGRIQLDGILQIDFKPVSPVALPPTLIGAIEFKAVWEKVLGATSYELDVALDVDFEVILENFAARNVGDVNEFKVEGLNSGVDYYYRVRALTSTLQSDDSNVIQTTTFKIDVNNSTISSSLQKILANATQESEVTIKLISEDGNPLPGVLVQLMANSSEFNIMVIENITDDDGIAKFAVSSSTAGEGVFSVNAGGLELTDKVTIIFLFADGEIRLGHNFPNPFSGTTKIPITIPERMNVHIRVFNSSGQLVDQLANREFDPGYYELEYTPRGLSSGVYILQMLTRDKVLTEKIMLIR